MDLFADLNLPLSVIPHWNNTDGGDDVDTSRCFIGIERFNQWCNLLPTTHTTLGLDEHTGIIIDFATGKCTVSGVSSVTLLRACNPKIIPAGAEFPISELGAFSWPENPEAGISTRAWEMVKSGELVESPEEMPAELVCLAEERQKARIHQDWASADTLRQKMALLGWLVQDTPEGQKIVRQL